MSWRASQGRRWRSCPRMSRWPCKSLRRRRALRARARIRAGARQMPWPGINTCRLTSPAYISLTDHEAHLQHNAWMASQQVNCALSTMEILAFAAAGFMAAASLQLCEVSRVVIRAHLGCNNRSRSSTIYPVMLTELRNTPQRCGQRGEDYHQDALRGQRPGRWSVAEHATRPHPQGVSFAMLPP